MDIFINKKQHLFKEAVQYPINHNRCGADINNVLPRAHVKCKDRFTTEAKSS